MRSGMWTYERSLQHRVCLDVARACPRGKILHCHQLVFLQHPINPVEHLVENCESNENNHGKDDQGV